MEIAPRHLSLQELEDDLPHIAASPRNRGKLVAIFIRPQQNQRQALEEAEVTPEGGLEGDRWSYHHWQKLADGQPDPRTQITLMNARVLQLISGGVEAMSLAGDNLIVDLDLSEKSLPPGTRLEIADALLEITAESHTGCGAFTRRYGKAACRFVNSPEGKALNLRGRYARVIRSGRIRRGDFVVRV